MIDIDYDLPDICLEGIYSGGQKKANSMSPTIGNVNPFRLKGFNYSLCSKTCKTGVGTIFNN